MSTGFVCKIDETQQGQPSAGLRAAEGGGAETIMSELTCSICGCTDLKPCVDEENDVCGWAVGAPGEPPICTFCADLRNAMQAAMRRGFESPSDDEPHVEIYSEGEANAYLRARGAGG
jgi:hypothetical protein